MNSYFMKDGKAKKIVKEIEDLLKDADKKIETLRGELIKTQNECEHPSECVKYHHDASGNNDWSDECILCGKNSKYLYTKIKDIKGN